VIGPAAKAAGFLLGLAEDNLPAPGVKLQPPFPRFRGSLYN